MRHALQDGHEHTDASTHDLKGCSKLHSYLGVAQVVERPLWEREVVGSSPTIQTKPPVSYNGIIPVLYSGDAGSIPASGTISPYTCSLA